MTLNLTSSLPLGFEHEARPRTSKVISETVPPTSNDSSVIHCMLAGGLGGAIGDSVMHSLDTVKTRQQGAPNVLKYKNTFPAFTVILKEEGVRLGLYGGYSAAMLGSFPSTAAFFGTYEYIKRLFIRDFQFEETVTHLSAGFLGDLASSVFYVPSEVLKTRLQLQGRFNNPHFQSGYNYRNTFSAISTIIRKEGWKTLFFGYKATLFRDLPFSALQFAFYEKFRAFALDGRQDLSIPLELATGAGAGGLAGILTTPLDVIKTRIQTQNPSSISQSAKPLILSSNSIYRGLYAVGKTEGVVGLFSGVGPRFIWTSVQSSIMLLLYQVSLRTLDSWFSEGAL